MAGPHDGDDDDGQRLGRVGSTATPAARIRVAAQAIRSIGRRPDPQSPAATRLTMTLDDLPTPAALVDEARLLHNIGRMQAHLDGLGVPLRPHVKTSKCPALASLQRQHGARGLTVSTLKEAEALFDAGFDDILYAVALAPDKIDRALALQGRGCALQLVVDGADAARAVVAAARHCGLQARVLIEIDVDGHRSGVAPGSAQLIEIGRILHDGGTALHGVMAHAGSSYDCTTPAQLQRLAEQERALSVHAAERLRGAGLPCASVSVGSTPTALSAQGLDGVTEVRAGVYVFFDLVMAGVGVCRIDEIALSVLCTVIGHQHDRGWALVDAGWMALSRDRGTQRQTQDRGYGVVCNAAGQPLPGLRLDSTNQEHGVIHAVDNAAGGRIDTRLPLGTRLRILPNHACATGAQHDRYHLVRDQHLVQTWPRFGGW